MKRSAVLDLAVLAALFLSAVAAAEKPTPTPAPVNELAELAKRVRINEDLASSKHGSVVITNENLVTTQEGGTITTSEGEETVPSAGAGAQGADVDEGESTAGMSDIEIWKSRHDALQATLTVLEAEAQRLDQELPGLWRRFYEEDNREHRDQILRPKLEGSLARKAQVALERNETEHQIELFFVEARRAGALPGWFR